MPSRKAPVLLLLAAALPMQALAQQAPAAPAAGASAAAKPARPAAHVTVIEDDAVRIEESRNRGRVQSITVRSKVAGVPAYQVQVAPAGRDPSQEKGAAGKRTWSLLDF
jgi:hypothetical protein